MSKDIVFTNDQARLLIKQGKIQYEFYKKFIELYFADFSQDNYEKNDDFYNDLSKMVSECPNLIDIIPESYSKKEDLIVIVIKKHKNRNNFEILFNKFGTYSNRVLLEFIKKFREKAIDKVTLPDEIVEKLDIDLLLKISPDKYTPLIRSKIKKELEKDLSNAYEFQDTKLYSYMNYHGMNTPIEILLLFENMTKTNKKITCDCLLSIYCSFLNFYNWYYHTKKDEYKVIKKVITVGIKKNREFFSSIAKDLSKEYEIFAVKEEIKRYGMTMTESDFELIASILKRNNMTLSNPKFKNVVSDEFMCYIGLKYGKFETIQ